MSQNGETKVLWLEQNAGADTYRILAGITDEQRKGLHHILSLLSDLDTQKLAGALEIEGINAITDVLTVISDLDHFEFYPDVGSERDLGVYLVESGVMHFPDSALPYLDYGKIGTDFRANHSGTYIDGGYVVRKDEVPGQMQDADRPQIFRVQLYASQGAYAMTSPYCLTLPASPERLEMAKLLLGVTDFSEAHIVQIECPIASLQKCIRREYPPVEVLNELAKGVEDIQASDRQLTDLCAILEAESPENWVEAAEVIQEFDFYEVMQHSVRSPADYAEYVLYQSKSPTDDFDFKGEVRDFIDYDAYGRYKMDEDGIRQTAFGLVRRLFDPFPSTGFEMKMQ